MSKLQDEVRIVAMMRSDLIPRLTMVRTSRLVRMRAARVWVIMLAVTVLTSLDRGDLDDLGFQCNVEELVYSRADDRRDRYDGYDGGGAGDGP